MRLKRRTTEEIAKARVLNVPKESIDMLFAPRSIRPIGYGKYRSDSWSGMSRLIVSSTGRIVAVFENPNDLALVMDALKNHRKES